MYSSQTKTEPEDSRKTIEYLLESIQQVIVENCQLQGQLEDRDKEVRWLQR